MPVWYCDIAPADDGIIKSPALANDPDPTSGKSSLQNAYAKKFGSTAPRFRRLTRNRAITSVPSLRTSTSRSVSSDIFQYIRNDIPRNDWSHAALQYKDFYYVDQNKFNHFVEKVENDRTICIFLSSPFDGCEKEREHFMKNAMPALTALCKSKQVYLSIVDMRWGITEEMGNQNLTVLACLRALDRSDLFLGYFGARYGSSNHVVVAPGIGQPTWIDSAVEVCTNSIYPYLAAYQDRSVTEMEFQHAFAHGRNFSDPTKPLSFFFYRSSAYDNECRDKFLAQNKVEEKHYRIENAASAAAAAALKTEIVRKAFDPSVAVHLQPDAYCSLFDNYPTPQIGADVMFECCRNVISTALARVSDLYYTSEAQKIHSAYARMKIELFVDFHSITRQSLEDYVLDRVQYLSPIFLTGESGSGKVNYEVFIFYTAIF